MMRIQFSFAILFFVACILLLNSCGNHKENGYSELNASSSIKIISFSEVSNTLDQGDLIEFSSVFLKNNKDTLLKDSLLLNELFNDTLTYKQNQQDDLMLVLGKLQEGDSCVALFYDNSNIIKRIPETKSAIEQSDTIFCYLKLKRVYKENERHAYILEENAIARYITFSKQQWMASERGIFYRIIQPSTKAPLQYNDLVKIVYKGYFLNRQVFDNYADINPYFEYHMGTQNQLIPGLEIALKYVSYGAEAEFIIPSSLAFGALGSSTGIVPAYKPVLYKLKVLESESEKSL